MIIMTSHKKSSSFKFWSCVIYAWPWCICPKNFAQIAIQFGVIDISQNPRWRPPPSWIFSLCEFGHSGVLIVRYLCSVPNLVQISVTVMRSTHICFRRSFDDVTRINFRFWLLVMWSSPHGRDASSYIIFCKISLSSPKLLTYFQN